MANSRQPQDPRFRSGPPASQPADPPPVPGALNDLPAGATWTQIWVKPESEVWRIDAGAETSYLKILDSVVEFEEEVARVSWAEDRSPIATPRLHGSCIDDQERGWILLSAVAGTPAQDPALLIPDAAPLVEALGAGLRRFHDSLDPTGCPFSYSVDSLIGQATARVGRGDLDPSAMGSTYRRLSPERLLEHLIATRPDEPPEDRVVAHGDPCQPNLLIDPTLPADRAMCGMVDLGRLGVSDRYRDLAIITRSLLMNLDAEVVPRFLDAYGLPDPDLRRLEWYVLVDDMW